MSQLAASLLHCEVMLQLREYRAGDFERLYALDQACFDPQLAYSRAELRFYIRHPTTFTLLIEDAGSSGDGAQAGVAGFLVAHRQRGGVGHIITIDVEASARRHGVGTMLMNAAEQRLLEQRCSAVSLETPADNVPAISFYLRRGYSIAHTVRGYYCNGLDALVMRKQL